MKTILPGAAVGFLGGGENSLALALAAFRMGYRVHVFTTGADSGGHMADVFVQSPYEDLDCVREFAGNVDVVAVCGSDVPALAVQAACAHAAVYPPAEALESLENGMGAKRDVIAATEAVAEFSVVGVRNENGAFVFYPPIAIDKVGGVFDGAQLAAPIRARVARQAADLTRDILEDLRFTGVACIEFMLTAVQELVVHEIIPHPHRSGHLTGHSCVTCQFEQQVRAVCGLPLGSTWLVRPAAMADISESAWQDGEPDWPSALALPNVKLSLYGGHRGHLAATATSATLAKQMVRAARAALTQARTA